MRFVSLLDVSRRVLRIFTACSENELLEIAISPLFFRLSDQYNPSYVGFSQDMEGSVRHVVRDQFGNVVGSVHDFAGSGDDDDEDDEDAGGFEEVSLVTPAMDLLSPVVRSPPPSVVHELYKAFKMLETNR